MPESFLVAEGLTNYWGYNTIGHGRLLAAGGWFANDGCRSHYVKAGDKHSRARALVEERRYPGGLPERSGAARVLCHHDAEDPLAARCPGSRMDHR